MSKDSSAKYLQNNKKYFKKFCEKYGDLSKVEKEKKQQYGRERHKNLLEDENKS